MSCPAQHTCHISNSSACFQNGVRLLIQKSHIKHCHQMFCGTDPTVAVRLHARGVTKED